MATNHEISGAAGQGLARELLIAYVNTGTKTTPVWSLLGVHVEDSSVEYDWSTNTKKDVTGRTWSTMRKPVVTQAFEGAELDAGETAAQHIWKLAVVEQDAQSLANQDMLIVHAYGNFAERYESCMIEVSSVGGEGGGSLTMSTNVTYGGTRTIGTATVSDGNVTFVADNT